MTIGTSVFGGHFPVGSRQSLTAGSNFTGVAPALGPVAFAPAVNAASVVKYVNPANPAVEEGDAGGLFTFGDVTVEITEILCDFGVAGTMRLEIADPDGAHSVMVHDHEALPTNRRAYSPPVTILPNHRLRVLSAGAAKKTVTVYSVRSGKRV